MNYATIKWTDIANGEGVRISLFVSGCTRHCKDCFNAVAWDFNYGQPFDEEVQNKIFEGLKADYIAGLSLLGGECYTGNVYDPATGILKETDKNTEVTEELLSYIDVLVDGEFVADLKNIRLKFRGSSNQRVLDMKKTKKSKTPVFYLD